MGVLAAIAVFVFGIITFVSMFPRADMVGCGPSVNGNNLSCLGKILTQYVQDTKGDYPPSLRSLAPYTGAAYLEKMLFFCDKKDRPVSEWLYFASGKRNLSKDTIIAAGPVEEDSKNSSPQTRLVLRADGSIGRINERDFEDSTCEITGLSSPRRK